ncbi:hypothetical protein PR202_gb04029 [Eleusine coracana subsp. coracana]|uniref:PTC1-like winged helix-turn-helix domain-containing protein n=1 Tax=Eleusine coracana subsp. coracana TaxID=191504 RepID=A0AAV5E3I9_ELECO|nr:hypothetical protein PR202_gb04029 [Eleusine coracana subsp. coracana]
MVVNSRPLKRARARVEAKDFAGFPTAGDGGAAGTFRETVRGFLAKHARLLPLPSIFSPAAAAAPPHLLIWRVSLTVGEEGEDGGGARVELNVVEEDVLRSRSVYCDQCRVVGWSGHPVCGKRYHFIIENDMNQLSGRRRTCCLRCGTPTVAGESRCLLCNFDMEGEELEECAYLHLDDSSHLLHAVVHANGYGHLLRVNGREGGSRLLTGHDIMSLWDRLCKVLHVRKVTVMDISKKHGMDYRLLHAVTNGHPCPIRTQLQNTIALYWALSDRQLVTLRDLFRFVMHLLHQAQKMSKSSTDKHIEHTSNVLCAWTKEDLDRAEAAMLKVLRAVHTGQWVSWRALRGAASKAVDSQEVLDYSLRELGGKKLDDGHFVAVRCNADTSTIEYRLESSSIQSPVDAAVFRPSIEHLLHDLRFLYDALLNPESMRASQPEVAEQLPDFSNFSDTTPVKHVLGSGQLVRVRGRCNGDYRRIVQFRMERGLEDWTVDSSCGAKDDDGERMLACDVWKCASPHKGKGRGGEGSNGGGRMEVSVAGRCKDEIPVGGAGKFGRMATVG